MIDIETYCDAVDRLPRGRYAGHITEIVGLTVGARGIQVPIGELCRLVMRSGKEYLAEVVGYRDGSTLLLPLDETAGLEAGALVAPIGRRLMVNCGDFLLGRVVDALGRPDDGGASFPKGIEVETFRRGPNALERAEITKPLPTGVGTIDGLLTVGEGQRIGIFAGSGVGKSTLLSTIARECKADINVIAMIGERGREVKDFIHKALGTEGLKRSVVVVATSDAPPLLRFKAAFTATAIAEHFRDRGKNVMVMMDSITRLAGAVREIGLSLGEPPTVKGYPPSFFSMMPKLVERMGKTATGSITGLLTVLVDADDMNEPVADTMRGLLDGHIVLSRKIASRGVYPAIDVLNSVSRVMDSVATKEHVAIARQVREHMAVYEDARDLVSVGAYKLGTDTKIDLALGAQPAIEKLVKQTQGAGRSFDDTLKLLTQAAGAKVEPRAPVRTPVRRG